DDIAQRPDLLDRSIVINLPSISEENRKDEKTFWKEFEKNHSNILGGLCDVVVGGLNDLPDTKLKKHPRMADFAIWITACERSLKWSNGEFMNIYEQNRGKAIDQGIESDPFASAVMEIMKRQDEWIGNASQLLGEASKFTDGRTVKSKAWPTSRSVRNRLRRINPSLRKKGIDYEPYENKMNRTLRLSSLSSYRHEVNKGKASNDYDNNYDNNYDDEHRHISSLNYDNKKTSSLNKVHNTKVYDDDYDNYDILEKDYKNNGNDIEI